MFALLCFALAVLASPFKSKRRRKGSVLLCGTCMDARGMSEAELLEGARRSTMDALANATTEADRFESLMI